MLRVFLVFLSLRLSVALPAALTCPSLCSLIAWCAPWSTRGDRRSISVADKGLAPRSMCPLTGLACILLTRMSTSERRVGEGRFFFVLPPCLLFPLFYFAWRCAQSLGATAQEGYWRCVNPFRAMPLHYRNKGCYPPRKPRFHPSVRCLSTTERRVGEGRFFFVSPPCLLFPLFYFAWRCAQPLRATAQEGYWHFVCSISWTHRPFDEASNDAGAGNERDVGATAENTGATARKRGAFRTALLVRLRAASTSRVVEPCRRRAREEVGRHGRERDKCRAKT